MGDHVSYRDWQAAMLRKEEEFKQNEQKGAFQATALQQTFRGPGFSNRRVGFGRHRGSVTIERGRAMGILGQRGFIPQRGWLEGQQGNQLEYWELCI